MMKKLKKFNSDADLSKNKKFVSYVYAKGIPAIGPGVIFIVKTELAQDKKHIMANFIATAKPDHVYINELTVFGDGGDFKKGFGTSFMKWLVAEADKRKIELRLTAEPLPVRSLEHGDLPTMKIPLSKLIAFYKKFGFKSEKYPERMIRKSKK